MAACTYLAMRECDQLIQHLSESSYDQYLHSDDYFFGLRWMQTVDRLDWLTRELCL